VSRRRRDAAPWLPLLLVVALVALLGACGEDRQQIAAGDADHGRELFVGYGCGACHQLGGVRQAVGHVGPRLDGLAEQRIIAGVLPNTPELLAAFIREPQAHAPNSGMPNVGVTPEDSIDIAAFLLEHR
jgi:cytochrome c